MTGPDAFEQAWLSFAGQVLSGLGPRELNAARVVFYAGGAEAFAFATSASSLEEEEACRVLDSIQTELITVLSRYARKPND